MRLTKDEILVIVFVGLALSVGAIAKHWRAQQRLKNPVPIATPVERPARAF